MNNKILDNYFFILFSLIPASIIFGPAISLINILLIDFSFIFLLIYTKEYKFLSNKTAKFILIFYSYLIFNSAVSEDFSIGALRNFGFIRFVILFFSFNYFFYHKTFFNKIFIIWALTLFIITVDTYIESFTGTNILGYGEAYGRRIVSFFKDEPIVGGYINSFYLIIVGYFFSLNSRGSKNYKYFMLICSLFFLIAIFLSGERSNAIKAILGFLIFYFINDFFKIKEKLILILLLFLLIGSLINNSDFLRYRYSSSFLIELSVPDRSKIEKMGKQVQDVSMLSRLYESLYFDHYQSGINVFKNYPFFGIGNKNYRLEACSKNEIYNYVCNAHPHQTYFEFLAEHGLIGTVILLFVLFNLIFGKLKIILRSKNYIQVGCFIFLMSPFIPLLPTGAFFGDGNLTIFWLNLSLMYAVNKKTNIFSKD
jgi:O-antigen ligase